MEFRRRGHHARAEGRRCRVAYGATNREAGADPLLCPKTIEAHLSRIYSKLGIRSRTELAYRFAKEGWSIARGHAGLHAVAPQILH
ncbi:MAG: response regulator transcription factor [Chloroflexi bacterium]|nr:MAG: response regulator transcription factor [Chloroflexota bacterium]